MFVLLSGSLSWNHWYVATEADKLFIRYKPNQSRDTKYVPLPAQHRQEYLANAKHLSTLA